MIVLRELLQILLPLKNKWWIPSLLLEGSSWRRMKGQLDPRSLWLKGSRLGLLLWRRRSKLMQQLSLWEKVQLAKESIQKKKKKTSLASSLYQNFCSPNGELGTPFYKYNL